MAYNEDIKIGFQIKLGFDNYFKNNTKPRSKLLKHQLKCSFIVFFNQLWCLKDM